MLVKWIRYYQRIKLKNSMRLLSSYSINWMSKQDKLLQEVKILILMIGKYYRLINMKITLYSNHQDSK